MKQLREGPALALVSAALFGVGAPATKPILDGVHPAMVAGLLYLGSAIGLTLLLRHLPDDAKPVKESDKKWLVASIVCGGITAPLLFVYALSLQHATSASLLLNFEGLFAAMLAWAFFGEHWHKRTAFGMLCILAGGLIVAWSNTIQSVPLVASAAMISACFLWALDSNCTRNISAASPLKIAAYKGMVAGPVNILLAFLMGASIPSFGTLWLSGLIGFFSYGLSLYFYIRALHLIGTARTAGYFATAPFLGAALSAVLLGEPVTIPLLVSAALCGAGVWLHLTEKHEHLHHHPDTDHEHMHTHDEHHQHVHKDGDPAGEPHSHMHHHDGISHSHPHFPDAHHRHEHDD